MGVLVETSLVDSREYILRSTDPRSVGQCVLQVNIARNLS